MRKTKPADEWGPAGKTALEILVEARRLAGDQWEWEAWEKRRLAEKDKAFGDDMLPRGAWCVRTAAAGAMSEYVKALATLKEVMGMEVGKYADQGWAKNVAAFDRAVKKCKA